MEEHLLEKIFAAARQDTVGVLGFRDCRSILNVYTIRAAGGVLSLV